MKQRLDVLLVERNLAQSRQRAKADIASGLVFVDGKRAEKPGAAVESAADIQVKGGACPYVSRGGLKLSKALTYFDVDVANKTAIDVGASTGGFTDCLLQNGAQKVYAVDVGCEQLASSLRIDPRVIYMERANIRYIAPEQIGEMLDLAVIDVSFISLKLVLPAVDKLLKETGQILCLIKPQFEAGRDKIGKNGVIRDPAVHLEVLTAFSGDAEQMGFHIYGITFSPVKGPEGNIEFLAHLSKEPLPAIKIDLAQLVSQAHEDLKGAH